MREVVPGTVVEEATQVAQDADSHSGQREQAARQCKKSKAFIKVSAGRTGRRGQYRFSGTRMRRLDNGAQRDNRSAYRDRCVDHRFARGTRGYPANARMERRPADVSQDHGGHG